MGPVKISLVQWRERSHGKGNSRRYACGRSQNRRPMTDRDSPRRRTDMREPANKRLITDVSGLAPTVARSSQKQLLTRFWRGSLVACPRVDNGHKSIPDWRGSSQGLAAVREFGSAYRRFGSRVRISLGERGAPYRRIDPNPDLNSTLKCIGLRFRQTVCRGGLSSLSPWGNLNLYQSHT